MNKSLHPLNNNCTLAESNHQILSLSAALPIAQCFNRVNKLKDRRALGFQLSDTFKDYQEWFGRADPFSGWDIHLHDVLSSFLDVFSMTVCNSVRHCP